VEGSCEYCNELSSSIKAEYFLRHRDSQFFKNISITLRSLVVRMVSVVVNK
jgi:hypothetical protein